MRPFTFVRFILFFACLLACSPIVSAQAETYTDEELDAMSDEDLELICIVRGFELVKDHVNEETGEVYTIQHSDYIEAAKQCLSIESEMNEILEEHPELREELEEEIIKMQQEQQARKEELEHLKQELQDNEGDASDSASEGAAFIGKPKMEDASDSASEGAAFVGKPKMEQTQEETVEEPATPEVEDQQTIQNETLEEEVEEEASNADAEEQEVDSTDNIESGTQSTADKMEGLEISDEERIPLNEKEEAALAEQEEIIPDDLTLEYLRVEFIKYVKKDIERVTRILIPILKPMLSAGDLAIRYIRAALSTLKDAYSSQPNSTEEKAEA
ncbi:unnamed protein product [Cylindrotheca closterium]|uniref:Uncharacterized protein n=1 Tax=Cylindrotheca closterium TaxID=2856 RepID=A0AAD2G2Z2_9STRA|nr:unnamed protein product [Cylindrotheca closterium]